MTTRGESPCAPKHAMFKSLCSTLVGMPVDGPARWELTMINGSSVLMARPMASALRAIPGPELEVTPKDPA